MRKQYAKTWYYSAVLAVLATCGLGTVGSADPEIKDRPRPLQPEVIKAWRDAGADVAWMKDVPPKSGRYQFWAPWREKEEAGAMPAFRFSSRIAAADLAKLPNPETAFGLDSHCGFFAGVTLKDLAKLKNLQSLCIGGVPGRAYGDLKDLAGLTNLRGLYLFYLPVTDSQVKHLAGMKDLRVLDLSHTPVTDMGLKELAGLKNLQWLNLRSTGVTPAGVAALEKDLPKCKILTGDR